MYTVWIGANDIFVNISAAGAGLLTAAQVQANITTAATDTLAQMARLRDVGAKRVMVFNLPDIGQTPLGKSTPQRAIFGAVRTVQFNPAGGTILAERRHHP